MGHRASAGEGRRPGGGSIQLHPSAGGGWTVARGAAATDRTAAAARAGGGRRPSSPTGWAHLSVRGRRRADWAGKGGRRWATAGLEKEGGGRAETIAQAEIQKSKKKNQF
jgi:hypothetical protein